MHVNPASQSSGRLESVTGREDRVVSAVATERQLLAKRLGRTEPRIVSERRALRYVLCHACTASS
jgi:hypothetical protein